jgi:hypothetical protein
VPSCGATNSSFKRKRVKLLTHTPFTQSLKQSVPIYFPLKSWPVLVPVDWNHINHRGRGCVTLDSLQGSASPLWRISLRWPLTLTILGLPTWSRHPARISVSLHQSEGPVCSSAASFSGLEGDPGIISGVHTSWFQGPPQAAEPGSGDPLPNRARWSDLTVASTNVTGRMLDQREQDSNTGGWRKGRFITLAGQHLDRSKNGTSPVAQGCRVLCLSMWKQASRKDKSRHGS